MPKANHFHESSIMALLFIHKIIDWLASKILEYKRLDKQTEWSMCELMLGAVQDGIILILRTRVVGQGCSILQRYQRLRYYSQLFDTREVDSTFYDRFYSQMTKAAI
jgi:hypothetical protein